MRPERPRRHVEMGGHLAEPSLDLAMRDGQEADHVGIDQRCSRSHQKQAGRNAERGAGEGVDHVVEACEGNEDADGQYGSGNGIADGRDPAADPRERVVPHALGEDENDRHEHGEERREHGQGQRVGHCRHQRRRGQFVKPAAGIIGKQHGGKHEADQDRRCARKYGPERAQAPQAVSGKGLVAR